MLSWEQKPGEPERMAHQVDDMVVIGAPEWVRHPIDGSKLYIKSRFIITMECPKGGHEVRLKAVDFKDSDLMVLDCPTCKEFLWVTSQTS